MHSPDAGNDAKLDALFQAYREACPDPDASASFMPHLWQRIEARQRYGSFFGRLASGFVTVSVALTLAMAIYLAVPHHNSGFYSESYVEALAGVRTPDSPDMEVFRSDLYPQE